VVREGATPGLICASRVVRGSARRENLAVQRGLDEA
jgi:hypothetical protein